MDRRQLGGSDPFLAFRDRYVGSFAGVSYDLAPGAVGVNPARIARAPDLVGRRVLITADRILRGPLHRRPQLEVVPVGRLMRNAREVIASGGLVFSTFDLEDPDLGGLLQELTVGDPLYLNAAMDRLPEATVRRPFDDEAGSAS